jgi:hypothetical protein
LTKSSVIELKCIFCKTDGRESAAFAPNAFTKHLLDDHQDLGLEKHGFSHEKLTYKTVSIRVILYHTDSCPIPGCSNQSRFLSPQRTKHLGAHNDNMDEFYTQLEEGHYFWWRLVPNRNGSTVTIPDMSRAFNETDLMEAALNRLRSTPHVLAVDVDDTAGENWTEDIEDIDEYDLPLDVEDRKRQRQREQTATLPNFTLPRPSGKRKVAKEKKVRKQRQGKGVFVEPSSPLNFDGYDDGPHEELPERIGVEYVDSETVQFPRYELPGTTYQPHSQPLEGIPVRRFDTGSHNLIVTYQTGNFSVPEMMTFGNHTFLRYGGWAIQCMTGHCGDALTDSFIDPASLTTHCQTEHASLVCSPSLRLGSIADSHLNHSHVAHCDRLSSKDSISIFSTRPILSRM